MTSKRKRQYILPLFTASLERLLTFFSTYCINRGYCQQMDTHMPELTVRESLLFSAKLRQPASVPLAEKEA